MGRTFILCRGIGGSLYHRRRSLRIFLLDLSLRGL